MTSLFTFIGLLCRFYFIIVSSTTFHSDFYLNEISNEEIFLLLRKRKKRLERKKFKPFFFFFKEKKLLPWNRMFDDKTYRWWSRNLLLLWTENKRRKREVEIKGLFNLWKSRRKRHRYIPRASVLLIYIADNRECFCGGLREITATSAPDVQNLFRSFSDFKTRSLLPFDAITFFLFILGKKGKKNSI